MELMNFTSQNLGWVLLGIVVLAILAIWWGKRSADKRSENSMPPGVD